MSQSPEQQAAENAKAAMRNIRNDVARLFYVWDPLALRGLRDWQKNYDEFIGPVAVQVKKRAPLLDIVLHLERLVTIEWDLPADRRKIREIAEKMHRAGSFLDAPTGSE
jgi:hypothetical protein